MLSTHSAQRPLPQLPLYSRDGHSSYDLKGRRRRYKPPRTSVPTLLFINHPCTSLLSHRRDAISLPILTPPLLSSLFHIVISVVGRFIHRCHLVHMPPSFKTFHNINHGGVVGVALQRHALLFTVYDIKKTGDPTIFQVTDDGIEGVFAPTFPSTAGFTECQIDVNPGLGPWDDYAEYVYVTQGSNIFEITPNGSLVQRFARISASVNFGASITFDRVGTFCYDMILTDTTGNVYRADPSMRGTTLKPFVNVHNMVLGDTLAVVPKCLGPHGGEIWVAAEVPGKVYSISASSPPTVTPIVDIPRAGNVSVIPYCLKEFGYSGGAYFAADWKADDGRILECPKSSFRGLGGNVLVGQETGGGIYMITLDRATLKYVATKFDNPFQGNAEGAAFVQCCHHHECC